MPERVAVIGLGLMGSGMAHNILRAGYALTVYNRTHERTVPLESAGAQVASTPRQAAESADIVISMVSDIAASRAVWLGPDGAMAGAAQGALLIESSTLTPEWVRELGQLAAERGAMFLDAPVSGSKTQAAAGDLVFFVGGDEKALQRARPILNAMGKTIYPMGPVGSGEAIKLINNLMAGVQIAAFAEGVVLAERLGLDIKKVMQVVTNGAPGSPIVKRRAEMFEHREYPTNFALRLMHKDLTYALEQAVQETVPLPTTAAAREVYRLAMAHGLSDQDFAAVIQALRPDAK